MIKVSGQSLCRAYRTYHFVILLTHSTFVVISLEVDLEEPEELTLINYQNKPLLVGAEMKPVCFQVAWQFENCLNLGRHVRLPAEILESLDSIRAFSELQRHVGQLTGLFVGSRVKHIYLGRVASHWEDGFDVAVEAEGCWVVGILQLHGLV